jgi:N-methylhydantoinase B
MDDRARQLDPVTFELIHSGLLHGAREMAGILKRSSHSPIIREMEDFSCSIFAPTGQSVAQDERIPAQLGAMSLAVQTCLAEYSEPGAIRAGDTFLLNHPYMGCMHTPDLNLVMPVFAENRLAGWSGATAHHVDIGGPTPGTLAPHHRELFAEGLIFPPIKLYIEGTENADLLRLISANVREPRGLVADLRAQHAACQAGERALLATIARYGADEVGTAFGDILRRTEEGTRAALRGLADGEISRTGFLDDDGLGGDRVPIQVRLEKSGDRLVVDFTGSSPQVEGALNVPWASTRACVAYLVRTMVSPDIPSNDGMLAPVRIECPEGTILNPRFPGAVSVRHNTCQVVADTLVRAASDMWPARAVASSSVTFFGLQIGSKSPRTGETAVLMEVVGGGTGAHDHGWGIDGVDTYMSNVALLPVEVAETEYAVRILKSELVDGSEGTGSQSGGLGIRREYQILDVPQLATLYCEQVIDDHRPRGAGGGKDALPTRVTIFAPDGSIASTASKTSTMLEPGSVIRVETSGGGGYGAG